MIKNNSTDSLPALETSSATKDEGVQEQGGGPMSGNSPSVELSESKDSALSSEKQAEKYYGADTIPIDETLWGMSYEQVEEQTALYSEKIAERYDTQIELAEVEEYDEEIRSGKKIKILGGYDPETKRIIIFADLLSSKTGTLMTIRHEELHHQIDTNPQLRKAQQQLVTKFKELNADIWRHVERNYSDKDIAEQEEELVVYSIERATRTNTLDELYNNLSPDEQTSLTQILNSIGYEKEEHLRPTETGRLFTRQRGNSESGRQRHGETSGARASTEGSRSKTIGVEGDNLPVRDLEVNAVSTVFGRREDARLTAQEEEIYRSPKITPEQQSLLDGPNSHQYPAARELSESKGSEKSAELQAGQEIIVRGSNGAEVKASVVDVKGDKAGVWTAGKLNDRSVKADIITDKEELDRSTGEREHRLSREKKTT